MPRVAEQPHQQQVDCPGPNVGKEGEEPRARERRPRVPAGEQGCPAPDPRFPQRQVTVADDLADQHTQRVILVEVVAVHDRTAEGRRDIAPFRRRRATRWRRRFGHRGGDGARPLSTSAERYRAVAAQRGNRNRSPSAIGWSLAVLLATYTSAVRSWGRS